VAPDGLRRFRQRLQGEVLTPGQPEYEAVRLVENVAFDSRPALIARARSVADVVATIELARESGLQLGVRSGGHSVGGHSSGDGVLLLDLSRLDQLEINPATRTATSGPGVLAGAFTTAAGAVGFAVPFGDNGHVGVGGITLGGGIGWLVRKHGLTIDSLLGVEIVTAAGEPWVASETENPDLFWAIRGGGGNFGVVTRYTFALHPIGSVLHGTILLAYTREALASLIEVGLAAADALTLMPSILAIPPIDDIPAVHHGQLGLFIDLTWAGALEAAKPWLTELRALGPVLLDDVVEKPYPAVYQPWSGNRTAWTARCLYLDRLDGQVMSAIERNLAEAPDGEVLAHLRILGGAAARVPSAATAYGWRDKPLLLWIISDVGSDDAARLPEFDAWAARFQAELMSVGSAMYVNFMADEGLAAVRAAYPAPTWERLRQVKRAYDPENLFRRNHNIPPSAGPGGAGGGRRRLPLC
jgi:FAD/FMN-containing dehydrogenase